MIQLDVHLDPAGISFIERFANSFSAWDVNMHDNMSKHLAAHTVEFVKPHVRSKTDVWGGGSGEAEKSVREQITSTGDGFDIDFYGNLGAFYMDEGNVPAAAVIDARQYGLKTFPVGKRNTGSAVVNMPIIHGMGHTTPSTPTHYSDLAMEAWESDDFMKISEMSLVEWLTEVVA